MLSLTEVVRRHYQFGAFANAHIRMTRELMQSMPTPEPREARPLFLGQLDDLLALRVVTSADLAGDAWELVDDVTGVVLHSGTFDPRCVDCDPKATGTGLPVGRCRGHRPAYQAAAARLLHAACGIRITEA